MSNFKHKKPMSNTSQNQFIHFTVPADAANNPTQFITFDVKAGVEYQYAAVFRAYRKQEGSPQVIIGFNELFGLPATFTFTGESFSDNAATTASHEDAPNTGGMDLELQSQFNFGEDVISITRFGTFTATSDGTFPMSVLAPNQNQPWSADNAVQIDGQFVLATLNQ